MHKSPLGFCAFFTKFQKKAHIAKIGLFFMPKTLAKS